MTSDLTWQQVIARRLARSHLLEPAPSAHLVDVVRDVALVQAQVRSAAEIGICVRVGDITAADVRRELYERRTLVKTWSIRGTLHLVPSHEVALWAAAVRGRQPYWETREWLAKYDLTPKRATALFDAIADALAGRCLTRADLATEVASRVRSHEKLHSAWGELLCPPALLGTLCFGPPRGASVTFVRADEWIDAWQDVDADEARREVLRRYLRAYGPARPADFQRWCGFGPESSRALFAELAGELEELRIDGTRVWLLAGDDGDFDRSDRSVRLLPQYDAYIIGFRPREPILPEPVKERIELDPKGRFESVTGMSPLVVDGVVTGFWRRSRSGKNMRVDVERVLPLRKGRSRDLKDAVDHMRALVAASTP